jgi:hypothetical protein
MSSLPDRTRRSAFMHEGRPAIIAALLLMRGVDLSTAERAASMVIARWRTCAAGVA